MDVDVILVAPAMAAQYRCRWRHYGGWRTAGRGRSIRCGRQTLDAWYSIRRRHRGTRSSRGLTSRRPRTPAEQGIGSSLGRLHFRRADCRDRYRLGRSNQPFRHRLAVFEGRNLLRLVASEGRTARQRRRLDPRSGFRSDRRFWRNGCDDDRLNGRCGRRAGSSFGLSRRGVLLWQNEQAGRQSQRREKHDYSCISFHCFL